jgi:sugar lactone lactonase YvrE
MSSNPVIKTVTDDFSQLAEGPYWDEENRVLYYVDAVQGDFKRLDPTTRAVQKINVGNTLVSIIIPFADEPNNFIISRYNQLLKLNWTSGNTSVIATLPPGPGGQERFNDAKCDPRGRLFIGTALEINGFVPNGGAFYRLDGNNLTELARGFTVSNGMAWSNDANHTKLFFNDSEGRKIYSFDYNIENGTISNQRVMIDVANSTDFVDGEYPDGMAIDEQGYIWVALWNGGRIVKIDTETARVVDDVRLPRTKTPSSLAIGDYEGKRGFFVTTALGSTPENERLDDGKILHISFEGGEIYKYRP